jgi:outer membrane protein assembly factor BamB
MKALLAAVAVLALGGPASGSPISVVSSAGPAFGGPISVVTSAAGGWDHPGYDAEDSYYNPHESVINASSIGHLTRRWSVDLRQQDPSCAAPSAPLVAGGRVFVTDAMGISAYQVTTGHLAWHFTWEFPDDSTTPRMAVAGNVLIAANGDCHSNSDPNGAVTALNVATGQIVWHTVTDTPVITLAVDKGVAAISGESPSDELTTIAFRATDGKVVWTKPTYSSSGVSANGRLLLTHGNATAAADITTGTILWTKPAVWTAQSATPASDRFVVTVGTALALVNASTGALVWTAPGKASDLIATDGRRVYRSAGHAVEALNAASGHLQWSRTLPAEPDQPIRAGGLLYTSGPILNAATGTVATPGTPYAGHQTITGGHLYTATDKTLSAFAP